MNRPWRIWLAFGFCAALLLGAMGWTSRSLIRLDARQRQNDRWAEVEERVRLALWRMDSIILPLLVEESARPASDYRAFSPTPRAYTKSYARLEQGDVLVPSPLLTHSSDLILLHFEIDGGGNLSSPQAPQGNERDVAETSYTTGGRIEAAETLLKSLRRLLSRPIETAESSAPGEKPAGGLTRNLDLLFLSAGSGELAIPGSAAEGRMGSNVAPSQPIQPDQDLRNSGEWRARSNVFKQAQQLAVENFIPAPSPDVGQEIARRTKTDALQNVFRAVWIEDALLLIRSANSAHGRVVQGCWLDWPRLRRFLLESIGDLFPAADLEPVGTHSTEAENRRLASLPAGLIVALASSATGNGWSAVQFSLAVAWGCVALAVLAVGVLLYGAVSLSERRAAFVSSVTHELRTPLTTFRLYSEMLAERLIPDEDRRQEYLQTLASEAQRLSHLVENVLAYARLERGAAPAQSESLPVMDLIARVRDRLVQRVRQAGLCWVEEVDPALATVSAVTDVSVVEQILFNLVDNACKHGAGPASNPTIRLECTRDGASRVLFRVRDFGFGVSPQTARKLFQPFSKSADEAAHSAPGVGLGLALSRQLSRRLRGDLTWDDSIDQGACFVLSLPIDLAAEATARCERSLSQTSS